MTKLRTAVISLDEEVTKKMRWEAPPPTSLVAAPDTQIRNRTSRTDRDPTRMNGVMSDAFYFGFVS
jgi:hypothetical protein